MILRSAWGPTWVKGQPDLHSETLSPKHNKRKIIQTNKIRLTIKGEEKGRDTGLAAETEEKRKVGSIPGSRTARPGKFPVGPDWQAQCTGWMAIVNDASKSPSQEAKPALHSLN